MLVAQVAFHWQFVGCPGAVSNYEACTKLLQASQNHYEDEAAVVSDLVTVHGWPTCTVMIKEPCRPRRRAMRESRGSYIITSQASDFFTILYRSGDEMRARI